jgi:hypothetical protein
MHELKPDELVPVEYLGIMYINLPEDRPGFTNALPWLLEAERCYSKNNLIYYNLACIYSLKGDLKQVVSAMNRAVLFGYSNFGWMSQDEDLENFRTTEWWRGIAGCYGEIAEQLARFAAYANAGEERLAEEEITFYASVVSAIENRAPHIPALRYNPLLYLTNSLKDSADNGGAIKTYGEALGIAEGVLGREHPACAVTLNNLGELYQAMGDYGRAESFYLEAKAIREKALGREHPNYAVSISNLSSLSQDMGAYPQAVELKQENSRLRINLVNRNFAFLSARQRDSYWNSVSCDFEYGYSLSHFHPVAESNALSYDNTLFSKGLLLRTSNAVRDAIYFSGDSALISRFDELGSLRQQIQSLYQSDGDRDSIESQEARAEDLDKSLIRDSAAHRDLQADNAMTWQTVQAALEEDEAAIEFASFRLYDKKWTDTTLYAALLLRPGMEAPLCDEAELERPFAMAEEAAKDVRGKDRERVRVRALYNEYGGELYDAVWRSLEKELEGVTTVYYSPAGILHKVAFNAVPVPGDDDLWLADRYEMNLVSSTREVARRGVAEEGAAAIGSAMLYGGITYTGGSALLRVEAEKYGPGGGVRLTAVPGGASRWSSEWPFLNGSLRETQNIEKLLNEREIPNTVYRGLGGNEESFKSLDGKGTELLHLATHGFFLEDKEKRAGDYEVVRWLGGKSRREAFKGACRGCGRSTRSRITGRLL